MAPLNNPLDSRASRNPLDELLFLTERRYLKNVTDATLIWHRVALENFRRYLPPARP